MAENVEIFSCRSCNSGNLKQIISLGEQYIVGFVDSKSEGVKCPLELVLCQECMLLQLKHNASPEVMWGEKYWYRSSINKMIRDDLKDIAEKSKRFVHLKEGNIVVDIGCNDGTLLEFYPKDNVKKVGFEPSKNVALEAKSKGFHIINDFFNANSFKKNFGNEKAKIVTAISMFYDLENPNKFLEDVREILDDDGLFVIQQNYLVKMFENNAFDNICHEHREYYSFHSLNNLLKRHGLGVFDVELNEINGGSIRTYIKKTGSKGLKIAKGAEDRINEIIKKETLMELEKEKPYLDFASRIDSIKKEILSFIEEEKRKGRKICALGASTRGNVILQYFGLGPEHIDVAFDKNPDKEGKMLVGSWIPITHPKNIEKHNPHYQLVLIWHIFGGVGEDEKEFLKKGGKFIIPLPKMRIIEN